MNKIYLTTLIFFFFQISISAQDYKQELDEHLQKIIDTKKLVGFSVAIFSSDKILYQNGFGYSNLENRIPFTTKTTLSVASISKTTIAVSLMKAQELGLLSLDDPINNYLPFEVWNPHFPTEKITIRHLATHTSGLKYSEKMTDHYSYDYAEKGMEAILREYLTKEGKWFHFKNYHLIKPGGIWDYSNTGATLAAFIIEQKAGMTFKDFTEKYIFDPLEMNRTTWFDGEDKEMSNHYFHSSKENIEVFPIQKSAMYPDGFMVTNVEDLTTFCQTIMKGYKKKESNILTSNSIKEMVKRQHSKKIRTYDGDKIYQGVFWTKDKNELGIPRKMIGHNGGDTGIFTMMYFDPKKDKGYIFLSNTGRSEWNHWSMVYIYQGLYKKIK